MRPSLALTVVALAACHVPATSQPLPTGYGAAAYGGSVYGSSYPSQSLRAAVWFDEYSGVASFDLSRPGHVAVFALQPMGRMELIYPTWGRGMGAERPFRSGRHSVRTDSRLYSLAMERSRYGRTSHRMSGQTYIILIASDRPLRLHEFSATGTLPWLDHPSITWNPFVATEHLVREVVPYQHADWTVAYHVVWPEAAGYRYDGRSGYDPRGRFTQVRCPGDVVISVPIQVVRTGAWRCPRWDDQPPRRARPRGAGAPAIAEVLPKRPRSTDGRGAVPAAGDRRAVPRTTDRRRPAPVPSPAARPPAARPAPTASPAARPRPAAKPAPTARPAPAVRQATPAKPAPARKAKPKKGGNGG